MHLREQSGRNLRGVFSAAENGVNSFNLETYHIPTAFLRLRHLIAFVPSSAACLTRLAFAH